MQYTKSIQEDHCIIQLPANCGQSTSAPLINILNELPTEIRHITINLSEVNFMISEMYGILLHIHKKAHDNAISLTLKSPTQNVQKALELMKLDTIFAIEA